MTVDDACLTPTRNNLTLVRLVLASAVIWTHSIWRVTGAKGDEFSGLLGAPLSEFAVNGFFFLSGFLVYASLLRRRSVIDFAVARLARLWPALFVSVAVTAAVGFFISEVGGLPYFGGATAEYVAGNLSLAVGKYNLTGVRCGDALCTVNGSLWTITWEVRCYLLLAVAMLVGAARPVVMTRLILPASLLFAIAWHLPGVATAVEQHGGRGLAYNVGVFNRLWSLFALGIAAFLWRERIRLSWPLLLAGVLALIASARWLPIPHLGALVTGYGVLCAGFLSARRSAVSGRWPDYSYGMYIYAFPVMMAIAAVLPIGAPPLLALLTFLLTLPLAALSWHFVEEPTLKAARSRMAGAGRPVQAMREGDGRTGGYAGPKPARGD